MVRTGLLWTGALLMLQLSMPTLSKSIIRKKTPFSLEEVFTVRPRTLRTTWFSAHEIIYSDLATGDLIAYNVITNDTKVVLPYSVLKKYRTVSYQFSPDNKYVLMSYDTEENYRHSSISKYVIYSLHDETYVHLANQTRLQHATWIPQHNSIIYVRENNIYYIEKPTPHMESIRITRNGIPGQVYNGVADWVYEAIRGNVTFSVPEHLAIQKMTERVVFVSEEVLGSGTSFSLSPDGKRLVFLSIDDTNITESKFIVYGEPGSLKDQYETVVRIPYPKPGTTISKYKMWHFRFADKKLDQIAEYREGREIIYGWRWVGSDAISLIFTNRVQNVSETDFCHLDKISCQKMFEDRNEKGWASTDIPLVSSERDRYLALLRHKVAGKEFYHIHLFYNDGRKIILTNGTFMVTSFLAWDQKNRFVYYTSSEPDRPSSNHVYVVSEDGESEPRCLTCGIQLPEGIPCRFASASININYSHFIGRCSGPTPSMVAIYENAESKPKLLRILDDNKPIRDFLSTKLQPEVRNLKVKLTDRMDAEVRLMLPPGAETSRKKYPLLIYVYGGPNAHQIKDSFFYDWSMYLTTNKNIIYGIIDGRGCGHNGTEMMYAVYRALGTVEMDDQISVTKHLRDSLSFIDPKRIGIWGWSYGGYATAKVLEKDKEGIFRCGVSVAPVSDWIYYNSIYTERYMGLPSENKRGYHESSLLHDVSNLKWKEFLLMHGTGDDNVHYQHAMHLARVLQEKKIMFEQQSYPDEAHGINGLKFHVYKTMDRFLEKCFRYDR